MMQAIVQFATMKLYKLQYIWMQVIEDTFGVRE